MVPLSSGSGTFESHFRNPLMALGIFIIFGQPTPYLESLSAEKLEQESFNIFCGPRQVMGEIFKRNVPWIKMFRGVIDSGLVFYPESYITKINVLGPKRTNTQHFWRVSGRESFKSFSFFELPK